MSQEALCLCKETIAGHLKSFSIILLGKGDLAKSLPLLPATEKSA